MKVQEGLFLGVCCTSSLVSTLRQGFFKAAVVAETAASIDKSTKSDTERKVHARNERLGIAFTSFFAPRPSMMSPFRKSHPLRLYRPHSMRLRQYQVTRHRNRPL